MQFPHLNGDECLAIIPSPESDEKTTRVQNGIQHKAGSANNAAPTISERRLLERKYKARAKRVASSENLRLRPTAENLRSRPTAENLRLRPTAENLRSPPTTQNLRLRPTVECGGIKTCCRGGVITKPCGRSAPHGQRARKRACPRTAYCVPWKRMSPGRSPTASEGQAPPMNPRRAATR